MRRALLLTLLIWAGSAAAAASPEASYRFAVAQMLAQEGRYEEALRLYAEVIELAPEDAYVRLEYAELLFRLRRWPEAARQASEARRLAPENLDVLRFEAQAELKLSEVDGDALDRAREVFEALRERAPDDLESMVPLGQIYLSQGHPERAAELFRQLLVSHPADRMLVSFLIDSAERAGSSGEIEPILQEFLRLDPDFLRVRLALSEIQSERGDFAAAARTLEDAPAIDRQDPDLGRRLAIHLYRGGDPERALEAIRGVLAGNEGDLGARYLEALLLADLGRDGEAESDLRVLIAEDPLNLDFHFLLSQLLERQSREREAGSLLEGLIEALEENGRRADAAEARLHRARMQARAEDWEGVLETSAAAGEVEEAAARVDLSLIQADALSNLGRQEEALAALERITAEGALADRVAARQAELLFRLERTPEAEERLARLADSADLDRLLLVAETYQRLEMHPRAIPVLERAREQSPDSVRVLFWLGAALERSGRMADAEVEFGRLLELDPEFAPALNYLGYMWAERGQNLDRALELVLKAVELDPDNGAYVDSLGWAYFQLGRYDEARGHLERAARLVPDDAVVTEHLADLYRAVGEVDRALELYRRAVSLEGENLEQVRRKLEELDADP